MNDVPLVKDNNINSINTSLIAVKKQLKQLTEAVGLIDVPDIDTSVFVKKSEVVDVVAADNMHSVSSNAVAESLSYSTQEQKTGAKYFNGSVWKDVYKKCFNLTGISNGASVPTGLSNVEKVLKIDGTMFYGNANQYAYQLNNPNDNGYYSRIAYNQENFMFLISGFGTVNYFITLEYVKTTD